MHLLFFTSKREVLSSDYLGQSLLHKCISMSETLEMYKDFYKDLKKKVFKVFSGSILIIVEPL